MRHVPDLIPKDPALENRVRESFKRQQVMNLIGARLGEVAAGSVEITLPFRDDLTQQDGYMHAGIITTVLDSSCGYAAFTLMPAGASVLAVEFKVNLLAPAKGEQIIARGVVKRAGRTLTVCTADAFAEENGRETLCATMLGTMFCLQKEAK